VIEFKSFHQNGNISETVAWKNLVFSTKHEWYMIDQI
jgi:hypothetical protein